MFNSYKKDQKSSSKNATIQKNRFQGEFCPIGRPRENDVPHCCPKWVIIFVSQDANVQRVTYQPD